MNKSARTLIVVTLIVIAVLIYFNRDKVFKTSAFEYVKKLGAKKTTSLTAGDRYDYPNSSAGSFGFYANDRAIELGSNPQKKGTYDKISIRWDDGSVTLLKDIFQ